MTISTGERADVTSPPLLPVDRVIAAIRRKTSGYRGSGSLFTSKSGHTVEVFAGDADFYYDSTERRPYRTVGVAIMSALVAGRQEIILQVDKESHRYSLDSDAFRQISLEPVTDNLDRDLSPSSQYDVVEAMYPSTWRAQSIVTRMIGNEEDPFVNVA